MEGSVVPRDVADGPSAGEGAPEPVVTLTHVSHSFPGPGGVLTPAITDITLTMRRGEFTAIVGPSGCGKTTILNLLAGLMPPTEGTIRIKGSDVTGIRAGDVGYMPAKHSLLPWRTALGNVEFALELQHRLKKAEIRERADDMLEAVGLHKYRDAYPHTLSQGMQQRVAIARTFVCDEDVLLMDEPFSALDAQTRMSIQEVFLSFWERQRRTVVLITHDSSEAVALADTVVLMSRAPGTIKQVFSIDLPRPRTMADLLFGDPQFARYVRELWQGLLKDGGIIEDSGLVEDFDLTTDNQS